MKLQNVLVAHHALAGLKERMRKGFDICADSNLILADETGMITSPNYPQSNSYQLECKLSIAQFDILQVTMPAIDRPGGDNNCSTARLVVGDETFCGGSR